MLNYYPNFSESNHDKVPSQQLVKNVLLFGYFLLIGGFVYDIQNQPSGMGQYVDPITVSPITAISSTLRIL